MAENDIMQRIDDLVAEEHRLRTKSVENHGLDSAERTRLSEVEVQLDQCWDLLRQRRAKSEFGEDPNSARVRPAREVEGYQN